MEFNTDNIVSISHFNHKNEDYLAILSKTEQGYTKNILHLSENSFEFIPETKELIESEINSIKLNDKETKEIVSLINKGLKINSKEENKEISSQKQQFQEIKETNYVNYKQLKTNEEKIEFLKKAGIEEGKVFEITAKAKNGNEKEESKAYFEVYKAKNGELYLRPDTRSGLTDTGYNDMIANASRLAHTNAIALLSDEFAKHRLNGEYQKTGLNNQDFSDYEITFSKKDVTKLAEKNRKELEKYRIEKLREKNDSEKNISDNVKLELISKVPETVENIYKNKNRQINEEIYTKHVFNMFKKIAAVTPEDRNISNFDKKIFKDLIDNMSKFNGDESKQLKIFNQWIFDNNKNSEKMVILGNLFEKTHSEGFKGYEIKRSEYTKLNRDKNLEAIEENKLPIMFAQDSVDYIYNPEDNKIYNGNTQIALHRNNNIQDYQTDTYVELPQLLKQNNNLNTNKKLKCELVDAGFDEFGRKHFQILVPCKPSRAEIKKEKQARKEEYRRNIADAKYLKKYGELPVYKTSLQPIPANQPPIAEKMDLKNPFERPTKESSIEEKLNYDYTNYFIAMLAKEKFEPATEWTSKENKEELKKFAKENPEKIEKIQSETFEIVRQQAHKSYINKRTNTNNEQLENINQNTASRSKTR